MSEPFCSIQVFPISLIDERVRPVRCDSLKMSLDKAPKRGFLVYSGFAENFLETSLPRVIPCFREMRKQNFRAVCEFIKSL